MKIQKFKKLLNKQTGATMVEYAIMVALIAVVSIVVVAALGQEVNTTFSTVNNALGTANG